jgi:hypothetical protein
MKARIALITTCTNRKTGTVPKALMARNLPVLPPAALAKEWVNRLKRSETRVQASELYCGRAFRESEACAAENRADLQIISAGYGLIGAHDLISPYNLTVAVGTVDSLGRGGRQPEGVPPDQWWLRVNAAFGRRYPLSTLVRDAPDRLYVLAVSGPYLELISRDLEALPESLLRRVRIIGPQLRPLATQARWSAVVLGYDDRLDGPDSNCRGTRSDFPQRAARHFLRTVGQRRAHASVEEHRQIIEKALSGWRAPKRIDRPRYTDEELRTVIDRMWKQTGGQVGRGLRLLRDSKKIACEQGRFKRLFWEVAAGKE